MALPFLLLTPDARQLHVGRAVLLAAGHALRPAPAGLLHVSALLSSSSSQAHLSILQPIHVGHDSGSEGV